MKVQGPSEAGKASKSKKSNKTSGSDSRFGEMVSSGVKSSAGVAATQSISKVDALLAVQGIDTATEKGARGRMKKRGDQILRQLDNIRLGILTSDMTMGQILDVADIVASHRENITDPELTGILDEIDLRAQIEIAKARKAMEDQDRNKI